jgi:hypothetical protein
MYANTDVCGYYERGLLDVFKVPRSQQVWVLMMLCTATSLAFFAGGLAGGIISLGVFAWILSIGLADATILEPARKQRRFA